MSSVQSRRRYQFSIADDQWHDAFGVTKNEGIVYVNDTKALNDIAGREVKLRVLIQDTKSFPPKESFHEIHVSVEDSNSIICTDHTRKFMEGAPLTTGKLTDYRKSRMLMFRCSVAPMRNGQGSQRVRGFLRRRGSLRSLQLVPSSAFILRVLHA